MPNADRRLNMTVQVLRWIAGLPSAVIGCLVGRFVFLFVSRIGMARYVEPDSFWWRVTENYVGGVVLGAIAVYAGSFVAPTQKKAVAVIMAGAILVFAGFTLFPSLLSREYWAILEIACMGLGACGVAYAVVTDEITFADTVGA